MAYYEIGTKEYDRANKIIFELQEQGCDFEFIESVEDYMYEYNRVTPKQLEALENLLEKWENRR